MRNFLKSFPDATCRNVAKARLISYLTDIATLTNRSSGKTTSENFGGDLNFKKKKEYQKSLCRRDVEREREC